MAPRRNLEMKVRYADLAQARTRIGPLGARLDATEVQTDTYFHVPHGRLKLREIEGRPAYLISYDRPDRSGTRLSAYHLVPVSDPAALKAALAAALDVRGAVRKRREIHLWHNVRIHLDEVAGLGTFVEFEAVLAGSDDEGTAPGRLGRLSDVLGITPADHLAPSYADLLGL